jgi:hypothetical protein
LFAFIFVKIITTAGKFVRTVGAATRKSPWIAPLAILALFLVV